MPHASYYASLIASETIKVTYVMDLPHLKAYGSLMDQLHFHMNLMQNIRPGPGLQTAQWSWASPRYGCLEKILSSKRVINIRHVIYILVLLQRLSGTKAGLHCLGLGFNTHQSRSLACARSSTELSLQFMGASIICTGMSIIVGT